MTRKASREPGARSGGVSALIAFIAMIASAPLVAASAERIRTSFGGSTYVEARYFPPDTMGAIGPEHFVELINGRYAVYTRDGSRLTSNSLTNFWIASGVAVSNYAFDPRVAYDAAAGRWYAVAVDGARSADAGLLFAVSRSDNPLEGWTGFRFVADAQGLLWADFPTLGYDRDGVYVSAKMIPVEAGDRVVQFWVFPKPDLLADPPTVANATVFEDLVTDNHGEILQPIVNLDGFGIPNPVLADFLTPLGVLSASVVAGDAFAPSFAPGAVIDVEPANSPPTADQPGPKQNLNAGDSRFCSTVILQQGAIWAVQTVERSGRPALRWLRIDAQDMSVTESGYLDHPELAYSFASIAVTEDGHILIGCSGSSENQFASAYIFPGRYDGASTTFGVPVLLVEGVASFERIDTRGRNRWGDYSATMIDPVHPDRVWTIQLYCDAEDSWATHIAEYDFGPLPCGPADLDENGQVGFFDLITFLTLFASRDAAADMDHNTLFELADVFEFIEMMSTHNCDGPSA